MNSVKVALSVEEKDQLNRDGFLVLENFVAPGKLAALRRRITELFAELGDRAGYEFKQEPQTDRLATRPTAPFLIPARSWTWSPSRSCWPALNTRSAMISS